MLRKTSLMKRSATLVLLVFGVLLGAAWAQTESVLYNFCAQGQLRRRGRSRSRAGLRPEGEPVWDDLQRRGLRRMLPTHVASYSSSLQRARRRSSTASVRRPTAPMGKIPLRGWSSTRRETSMGRPLAAAAHGVGVVFKLTPEGKETVLYSFCAQDNCPDGDDPSAGLVLDQKGNLYGTTPVRRGPWSRGVVFKLTPKGKETVLYSFCAQNNCADGAHPMAGLVFDQKGNLYGTTYEGGSTKRLLLRMRRRIQAHSKRQGNSPLQLLCAEQLRRRGESRSRAGLRPEGKPVWDDRGADPLQSRRRRIQAHSERQGDSPLQLLCADQLRRRGSARCRADLRQEGKPVWNDGRTAGAVPYGSASYSSSLPKARRQSSTASVRSGYNCADGAFPQQGWSSTRRETCMGQPSTAGPPAVLRTGCGIVFKLTP